VQERTGCTGATAWDWISSRFDKSDGTDWKGGRYDNSNAESADLAAPNHDERDDSAKSGQSEIAETTAIFGPGSNTHAAPGRVSG
jgi:hypothetical protein